VRIVTWSRLVPLLLTVSLVVTGCAGEPASDPAPQPEPAPGADVLDGDDDGDGADDGDGDGDDGGDRADDGAGADDGGDGADGADATVPNPTLPSVPPLHPSVDGYPEAWVTLQRPDGAVSLPVKLADTQERRTHGLMEVPDLPDGTGMLFVFDEERTGGFWMKDTLVPLDIAFADADGEIVAILAMDPCEEDPCEVHEPGHPYQAALEVPQGWFASQGIEVGTELTYQPVGDS
jgi:uncharacterized protein